MSISPRALNEAALEHFIYLPVNTKMVNYLAQKAREVIQCDPTATHSKELPPSPPQTPPEASNEADLPSLEKFIQSLIKRSNVQTPTLMTTLVYLDRLRQKLPPVAKGLRCTVHRIFLAALILSAKFLNDSSPKNKHWAEYSNVRGYEPWGFSRTEVNLMEKQLLFLLDWDLNISADDLYTHLDPFLAPIRMEIEYREHHARQAESRKAAIKARKAELARQKSEEAEALRQKYAAANHYHLPRAQLSFEQDRYMDPMATVLATYSNSPPSSAEVPSLARSSSVTSTSRSSTPASSISYLGSDDLENYYSQSPIRIVETASPSPRVNMNYGGEKHGMLPYEIERSPSIAPKAKKARMATGNIFSRFLGGQKI